MKRTTWKLAFGNFIFILALFLPPNTAKAQCPTVADNNQFFCDTDSPRISSLAATDNGSGIAWYVTATGGTPLSTNTPLQNNTIYFADDNTGSCGTRAQVLVTIQGLPPTNVDVALSRCSSDVNTIAQLSADGLNIEWFDSQNGGNLLPLSTQLVNGTTYWAQQTENGCISRRLPTTVTIIDPGAPTGDPEQFFCIDPDNPTVFTVADLTANGTEIVWYESAVSTSPLDPTLPLTENEDYFASQTSFPCESEGRFRTIVRFDTAPDAGEDGTLGLCENETTPVNLFSLLSGSPDNGGTWTGPVTLTNGDLGTLDPTLLNEGSFSFTYTVEGQNACPDDTATITVTIDIDPPNAGTDGSVDLCSNDAAVDLFTLLGDNPDTGGSWSPALTSGSGIFDPATDPQGIYTYTVTGSALCGNDTATVNVSVTTAPNAGVSTSASFCGDDPAINLFSLLGSNADSGGTWTGPDTLTNGDQGTFIPSSNTTGTYTYTVPGAGTCADAVATVEVSISNPNPTLNSNGEVFCETNDPTIADLINNINAETNGTITVYDAQNGGNTLSPGDPLIDGTTYYVTETDTSSGCESTNRLAVTVSINNPPVPTLTTTTAGFCLIDSPVVGDLNNFIDQGTNPVWFDSLQNGLAYNSSDPLVTGTYYAAEQDANGCFSTTRVAISVIVNNDPAPTLVPDGANFCGISDPTLSDLEANVIFDNSLSILWYDAPEGGNVLSLTTLLVQNETYYAAVFNSGTGCESSDRLPVIVDLTNCDPDEFTLFIPDGFSPNGDNLNDTYELNDIEFLFPDYTIEIYNRYGNLVYQGNRDTPHWDGTSNQSRTVGNNILPNGVYFYIINFNRDNLAPKQGRLYLNR
ncbi:gliding motility-associated C-terminal domain-containing protein [Ascidiimonas aurantiaca]|uniref:Ig-like domain-containing protein n=1 Tax=Ascidiimonas aurantiaca TaxID=1685432 RepID=UPI0030EB8665